MHFPKVTRIVADALSGFAKLCSDIFAEVACDKFLAVQIVIDELLQALHPHVILISSGRNPN
jgi:hypothetical protein